MGCCSNFSIAVRSSIQVGFWPCQRSHSVQSLSAPNARVTPASPRQVRRSVVGCVPQRRAHVESRQNAVRNATIARKHARRQAILAVVHCTERFGGVCHFGNRKQRTKTLLAHHSHISRHVHKQSRRKAPIFSRRHCRTSTTQRSAFLHSIVDVLLQKIDSSSTTSQRTKKSTKYKIYN